MTHTTDIDLNRERRLRTRLAALDLRLAKTPARHWTRDEYGIGYMVIDGNTVIEGCGQREYEASLDMVEACAERHEMAVAA